MRASPQGRTNEMRVGARRCGVDAVRARFGDRPHPEDDRLADRDRPVEAFFLDYDPLVTVRKLKTPVLILNGGTDQQVTPDQVPKLVAAFTEARNRDITARVFGNLNHLFIYDPSGYPMGYMSLTRRDVEPELVGAVVEWLVERLR
jgi:fermentation-respiration switch protein FrsA (DUF1100 family)